MEWDPIKIQQLIAFRISRAINTTGTALPFEEAWHKLFQSGCIGFGHKQQRKMTVFEYMAQSTHLRPRDFVKYIQICAEATNESSSKISLETTKQADKTFSNYLKRELTDEIHGVVPDISAVFDVLSKIRKQTFSLNEFETEFSKKVSDGSIKEKDANFVLRVLFLFSVIGNQPRQINQKVFKYSSRDAEPNFQESFVVHRGLLKSLQIL